MKKVTNEFIYLCKESQNYNFTILLLHLHFHSSVKTEKFMETFLVIVLGH